MYINGFRNQQKLVLVKWVAPLQAKVWNASSAAPVGGDYLGVIPQLWPF